MYIKLLVDNWYLPDREQEDEMEFGVQKNKIV